MEPIGVSVAKTSGILVLRMLLRNPHLDYLKAVPRRPIKKAPPERRGD